MTPAELRRQVEELHDEARQLAFSGAVVETTMDALIAAGVMARWQALEEVLRLVDELDDAGGGR